MCPVTDFPFLNLCYSLLRYLTSPPLVVSDKSLTNVFFPRKSNDGHISIISEIWNINEFIIIK